MENSILRKLILEALKEKQGSQYLAIVDEVEKLAAQQSLFPTQDKRLGSDDKIKILEIIWDLIIERILTVGLNECNPGWPFVRLSEYGESVVKEPVLPYYDPEEYGAVINSITPSVDGVIKQYAIEGINCFRQRLFFASAVMFGAAAEKTILTLLESIINVETDHKTKSKLEKLLERPNLPETFAFIRDKLDASIKARALPYRVIDAIFSDCHSYGYYPRTPVLFQ
ncbi:MAG: hypothetical protein L6404_04715 [Candidatus Omnitrophica bacterium]|nr:hypothetical protein [Candidatus Omnitrophota bacterium]